MYHIWPPSPEECRGQCGDSIATEAGPGLREHPGYWRAQVYGGGAHFVTDDGIAPPPTTTNLYFIVALEIGLNNGTALPTGLSRLIHRSEYRRGLRGTRLANKFEFGGRPLSFK